ncbi:MAG: gas vesicle protein GvpN [Synechococcales cyanobacterium T60_A2020_003]|nr:gas vesicle protein GvpN [Synechococcales cyanobacterium T60_A2020_003]
MTTVLHARPRGFVSTPAIERIIARALRYLQSGFPVHLRGAAGTGKTTLALHLADLLSRPIMLLFGDDEFKSTDLIGNQSGYTRKKVVDNFIHSVVKMEDELRHNWVDSRLTLACREGFTLVYDEFNRSRPEVNNVLLSALEEKLLVLPPSSNRNEYIRVNPHFRAIFTSNPEEYCGVHATQDALLDRLITINIPEPDELTQQEIIAQKVGIDRQSAVTIVQLVRRFRVKANLENSSGLRSCLMISKICHEHGIIAGTENAEFRDLCQDILLSRSGLPVRQATQLIWETFNELVGVSFTPQEPTDHLFDPYRPPVDGDLDDSAEADALLAEVQAQAARSLVLDTPEPQVNAPAETNQPEIIDELTEAVIDLDEAQGGDEHIEDVAELENSDEIADVAATELAEADEDEAGIVDALAADSLDDQEPGDQELDVEAEAEDLEIAEPTPTEAADVEAIAPSEESVIAEEDTLVVEPTVLVESAIAVDDVKADVTAAELESPELEALDADSGEAEDDFDAEANVTETVSNDLDDEAIALAAAPSTIDPVIEEFSEVPFERDVYAYLQTTEEARPSEIEVALSINRFQSINALRSLVDKGLILIQSSPDKPSTYRLNTSVPATASV